MQRKSILRPYTREIQKQKQVQDDVADNRSRRGRHFNSARKPRWALIPYVSAIVVCIALLLGTFVSGGSAAQSSIPGYESGNQDEPQRGALNDLNLLPLLAPVPSVTLGLGPSAADPTLVLLGDDLFTFTVTFDNTSGTGTDVGYGPFIDLVFPVNGADGQTGTADPDGVDFIRATYLGTLELNATSLTFPDDDGSGAGTTGCVDHPYARDTAGDPKRVCGTAGDVLVVLELPFGSFAVGQPPVEVTVEASLSDEADVDIALPVWARGGFRYGADPLDNWCCDAVILLPDDEESTNWNTVGYVKPRLLSLQKDYSGPEDETATGPNFPRRYTITVDIAPNQKIEDLMVTDVLPDTLAYTTLISTTSTDPSTIIAVLDEPLVGAAAPASDNELIVRFSPVTADSDPDVIEVEVVFEYFVPEVDADGKPVIDPDQGDDDAVFAEDQARAGGEWTPVDDRDYDPGPPVVTIPVAVDGVGPEHTLELDAIAIQKEYAGLIDPTNNGISPGDTITYTLDFQVSDYFTFGDIVITDVLGDGQRLTGTPTLTVTDRDGTFSGDFTFGSPPSGNLVVDTSQFPPAYGGTGSCGGVNEGTTTLTFYVSEAMTSFSSPAPNDILTGGRAVAPDAGAAIGQITFQVEVQDEFACDFPSEDRSVDQGDDLQNNVTIGGEVYENSTQAPQTPDRYYEEETSDENLTVVRGSVEKSIYAVNGTACDPQPCSDVGVSPSDTLTYRIVYRMPSSDVENLKFTDYLPLPVFRVNDPDGDGVDNTEPPPIWTFDDSAPSAAVPLPGVAKFGPSDSFYGISSIVPALSKDAPSNSLAFTYGDYDDTLNRNSTVDILFTITVRSDPFTDGLYLTNQLRQEEGSTFNQDEQTDTIIQFRIDEPYLVVKKGVIASSNDGETYSPSPPGPVDFTDPGSTGTRWTGGDVTSGGLASSPIDSDLGGVDAADMVSFAITIENIGHSRYGVFDMVVEDTIPDGFSEPPGGYNLRVTRGDGVELNYTGDLFGAGLEIVDPPGLVGACEVYDPSNGKNIAVITYDLILDSDVEPLSPLVNTATLTEYAGEEGGQNYIDADDDSVSDDATVTVLAPQVEKTILSTNQNFTDPGDTLISIGPPVAIGEIIEYQTVITVPEGIAYDVTLRDTLDQGLAFVSLDSIAVSNETVLTTSVGTFDAVLAAAEIQDINSVPVNHGRRAYFDFGTVENIDTDNETDETITLTYKVVVLDWDDNDRGDRRRNLARWYWEWSEDGSSHYSQGRALRARIFEPIIEVTKDADPESGDAGDEITFSVIVEHDSEPYSTDGFELVFSDPIPAGMTYVDGSLDCDRGFQDPDTCSYNSGTNTIEAAWTTFTPAAGEAEFEFKVNLAGGLSPGQVITNTADLTWTSLPGDVSETQADHNDLSVERTYNTQGSDDVTVFNPGIGKVILSTNQNFTDPGDTLISIGPPVAIGEQVQYRVTVTVPEATSAPVFFRDTLDEGMAFVSCDEITASPPLSAEYGFTCANAVFSPAGEGRVMEIDFGDVTNSNLDNETPETVTITYTAIILNDVGVDQGDTLHNTAEWRWAEDSTSLEGVLLMVVEPVLVVTKTADPPTGNEFDEITFRIVVEHDALSDADAFELALTDDLSGTGLTFVEDSLDCMLGSQDPDQCSYDSGADTITAAWNPAGGFTLAGGNAVIEFRATLPASVTVGQVFTNDVQLTWTGLSGNVSSPQSTHNDLSVERTGDTGDAGGAANDYSTEGSAEVLVPPQDFEKDIVAHSASHTPNLTDAAIGEIFDYAFTFVVPANTTMGETTITDILDRGLAFVGCVEITATGQLTTSIGDFANACPVSPAVPSTNPTVDRYPADSTKEVDLGRKVVWNLGTIENNGSEDVTVTVRYQSVVLNNLGNLRGTSLANQATLDWDGGSTDEESPPITLVEPTLEIEKTAGSGYVPPEGYVTFTLTVRHAPESGSDAFDLILADAVPSLLSVDESSLDCTLGAQDPQVCAYDQPTNTLSIEWTSAGGFTLTGGEAVITFQVRMAGNVGPGTRIRNTATLEWTSMPDEVVDQSVYNPLSDERTYDPYSEVDVYQTRDSADVRVPELPDTGFAPNRTTSLPDPVEELSPYRLSGMWIEIPKINLFRSIMGVPFGDGGWDLTWLRREVGYLEGTAFPSLPGNTALTAHVYLSNGLPGPFVHLPDLRWGDEIVLYAGGMRYLYKVREVRHVAPDDLTVLEHETYDWLTLITCEGYDEATDAYQRRVAVRAILVQVMKP
jgi:LPXTG-site transpeptidase (sortase) family protein